MPVGHVFHYDRQQIKHILTYAMKIGISKFDVSDVSDVSHIDDCITTADKQPAASNIHFSKNLETCPFLYFSRRALLICLSVNSPNVVGVPLFIRMDGLYTSLLFLYPTSPL